MNYLLITYVTTTYGGTKSYFDAPNQYLNVETISYKGTVAQWYRKNRLPIINSEIITEKQYLSFENDRRQTKKRTKKEGKITES